MSQATEEPNASMPANWESLRDPYAILGLSRDASESEIKKVYRALALRWHPDKNPGDAAAAERFTKISGAYEILSNPEKRQRYDQYGDEGAFSQVNPMDLFGQIFGTFASAFFGGDSSSSGGPSFSGPHPFSGLFGASGAASPSSGAAPGTQRTPDEEFLLALPLVDFYKGCSRKIQTSRSVACVPCAATGSQNPESVTSCASCAGAGQRNVHRRIGPDVFQLICVPCESCGGKGLRCDAGFHCEHCGGAGSSQIQETLEVQVPRGARPNDRVVFREKVSRGDRRLPGDLHVRFVLEAPPQAGGPSSKGSEQGSEFQWQGKDDLVWIETLSLAEALTGFRRHLQTLDKREILLQCDGGDKVVCPGDVMKVLGEGLPLKDGAGFGNLFVVFRVAFPSPLPDAADRALLRDILLPAELKTTASTHPSNAETPACRWMTVEEATREGNPF